MENKKSINKDEYLNNFKSKLSRPFVYLETPIAHVIPPYIVSKDDTIQNTSKK